MFWDEVQTFVCAHEPGKMHRFFLDVGEVVVLFVLGVTVIKLFLEIQKINKKFKEKEK